MTAARTYCERCGSELMPTLPGRCLTCESIEKVARELGTDEQALLGARRALNAVSRDAAERGISIQDAQQQADAREEAGWDALLADDPTPVCVNCGAPLSRATEPCAICRTAAQNARKAGKSSAEVQAELALMRRAYKRYRAERASMPAEERERSDVEAQQRLDREWAGELPPGVPPLQPTITLPCQHLHPDGLFRKMQLQFTDRGVVCLDPRTSTPSFWMPWKAIGSVTIEAPDSVQQRATLPRLAVGGVFALGFKKRFERSYVIVHCSHGEEDFFEITGLSTMDVRARLSPMTAWLRTYGEDVRSHVAA
jgi:hypothetical protein